MPKYNPTTSGNPYVTAFHDLMATSKDFAKFLSDSAERQGIRQGFTDAVNRGAVAATLGAPVDMANTALNLGKAAVGYLGNKAGVLSADQMPQLIDNPVGGSEYIGNQMRRFGVVSPNRNALAESIAGFLPVSPSTSGKAVAAIAGGGMVPGLDLAATVFHGSPHKFDRFDSSKIGTGEGAQAYGHGLYLAESPEVAKSYRESLTNLYGTPTTIDGGGKSVPIPLWLADKIKQGGSVDTAIAEWTQRAAESRAAMKSSLQPWIQEGNAVRFEDELRNLQAIKAAGGGKVADAGSLYKVDLPDEAIAKMLDWDKPLSQQAPALEALSKNKDFAQYVERIMERPLSELDGKTLQRMAIGYAADKGLGGASGAADVLRQAGIPGIRYLDAGSRGQGQGTSNYVVFPGEENMLRILERNGQVLK